MPAGISGRTAQADAMAALLDAARVALADEEVDIGFGFRWPIKTRDWFFGADTSGDIDPKTIGPRRALGETLTLTVSVGTWAPFIPGAEDDEATELKTLEHAFDLLGKVQDHIRTQDITLGGTVLWCVPGSSTSQTTDADELVDGRVTEIIATFVCSHRIATA